MNSLVHPELPTASVSSLQAPTATVDNFTLVASRIPLINQGKLFKQPGLLPFHWATNAANITMMNISHIARNTMAVLLLFGVNACGGGGGGGTTAPIDQQNSSVGLGIGCSTAYFIDKDCDGYGVGKKSNGKYTLGFNGEVLGNPLIETSGDMPDEGDEDPTVHTTDEWRAKWGSDNSAIVNFLSVRKRFTNFNRVYYLSLTGNDATGVVKYPTPPYRTMAPILKSMPALKG